MDPRSFDELARRVAMGSRRKVLGGLLGGLAAAFGIHGSDAAKKGQDPEPDAEQDTQPTDAEATPLADAEPTTTTTTTPPPEERPARDKPADTRSAKDKPADDQLTDTRPA